MGRRAWRRTVAAVAVTVALVLGPGLVGEAWPRWWNTPGEADLIAWLNGQRTWYGPAALIVDPDLTLLARAQATRLRDCGCLFHQDLTPLLSRGWTIAGENVGHGGTLWDVHVALSYSPGHLRNMLDRRFIGVGVGVAYGWDGRVFVAQVFGGF